MTVYNGEKFLDQAIQSILAQDFKPFELILVDDGSEDDSCRIADSYSDNRVVLHRIDHVGRSNSLNFGISVCEADYVAFLDADDISAPSRLKEQFQYLEQHSECDVVASYFNIIDETGKLIDRAFPPGDPVYGLWRLHFQCNLLMSTVMLRKNKAIKAGLFPENMIVAHDYELFLNMANPFNTSVMPRFLTDYRMVQISSQLTNNREKMIREACSLSNRALQRLKPDLNDEMCSELRPMYWRLERQRCTSRGLANVEHLLAGFIRHFQLESQKIEVLRTRVISDMLRAVIGRCDGSSMDRLGLFIKLIRTSPASLGLFCGLELKRIVLRLFKRTRLGSKLIELISN
jgi:glycosyltransferase involved in cell wall biosynthesis